MSDILSQIVAVKREEIAAAKKKVSFEAIRADAESRVLTRDFEGALRRQIAAGRSAVIAEIKKASPSKGLLRADFIPADIAQSYAEAGAACLSVLTDRQFFQGQVDYLKQARASCDLPVLRKDFMFETYQVAEARSYGADCILIILAAVGDDVARYLLDAAAEARAAVLLLLRDLPDTAAAALLAEAARLGLDTLVEAHDAEELERAAALAAPVIGVNARDLSTFELDRPGQLELLARAPRDRILVAESAIESRAQGAAAELAGAHAILVGSTLMRAADPGAKLAELVHRPLVKVCGLTRQEDADAAVEAGADLLGFILARESPRRTDELLDAPATVLRVAVFVGDAADDTGADLVQLYARENGHRARDGALLRGGERVATVVDLPWEQDDPTHLDRARATEGRVMLAGGLDVRNVYEAIETVHPWAVDSARSTESEPGVKDHDAVRAWVAAAR